MPKRLGASRIALISIGDGHLQVQHATPELSGIRQGSLHVRRVPGQEQRQAVHSWDTDAGRWRRSIRGSSWHGKCTSCGSRAETTRSNGCHSCRNGHASAGGRGQVPPLLCCLCFTRCARATSVAAFGPGPAGAADPEAAVCAADDSAGPLAPAAWPPALRPGRRCGNAGTLDVRRSERGDQEAHVQI